MLFIRQFNQRFAIRRTDEFAKPRIIPLEKLEIPRGSIFHTIDMDQVVIAPPASTPYLQVEKPAQIRHHFKLAEDGIIGRPISVPIQGQERQILAYHRENRRFRRMGNDDSLVQTDLKVLLIENYTPMLPRYRYPDTLMSWYERLHNVQLTITNQIKTDADVYMRQNYLFVNVGDALPAFDRFKNTYNNRVKNKLERFNTFDSLWLLELFGWAIGDTNHSLFGGMDINQLSRVNVVFIHNAGFSVMNLGTIERMRKDNGGRLTNDQVSRCFYRMLIQVMTAKPLDAHDIEYVDSEGNVEIHPGNPDSTDVEVVVDDDIEELSEEEVAAVNDFDAEEDVVVEVPKEDVKPTTIVVEKTIDHGDVIKQGLESLAEASAISAKAYRFLSEAPDRLKASPNPYNPDETYEQGMTIDPKDLEVKPKKSLVKTWATTDDWTHNSIDDIEDRYNADLLRKDVLAAVASSQRLGLVVHDHRIEKEISVTGNIEHHTLRVQPYDGEPVTVRFSIPILTPDGTWVANGTEYTMRRQRVDVPIRKISYDTVSLTTGYGKNFVSRSEKVVNDYGRWLTNNIIVSAYDLKDTKVTDARLSNVFVPDHTPPLPKHYTMMARRVAHFNSEGYLWNFDIKDADNFFGADVVKDLQSKEMVPVAKGRGKAVLGMDNHSQLYKVVGDNIESLGTMSEFIGYDQSKKPREVTELSIMGKSLTLGFIFSYYLGLTGMLRHFGIQYEILPPGQRVDKSTYDTIIRLADAKIVISCDNDKQRMILNGLDRYVKHMTTYTESEVEREDIYLNLIRDVDKLTPRYIKELKTMRTGYVDDMHARILRGMGEPETFIGLLERANEMLLTDYTKPEINADEMMFVGKQRISYHIYTAMTRAMRNYNNAPGSNRKFELSNDMVWGAINSDPSVLLAPGANPIQPIKEKDVVTLGGTGGRGRQTMVQNTRIYDKTDLGVVSGNTVDSTDVAITAFLTNNPRIVSIDGVTGKRGEIDQETGSLFSYIDGLVPDGLMDDGKRQNFVGIQFGSATTSVGAYATPYRTELEKTVAHRTSKKHARIAEKDGKIISKDENQITIKYADGQIETVQLGRWFGAHEGTYYPHTLVSRWNTGDKITAGTVLAYNEQHFEPDLYDKTQVNYKNGIVVNTALIEGEEVVEDSCGISDEVSMLMEADTTKVKDTTMGMGQFLLEILPEGAHVDVDTILCTFSDTQVEGVTGFSAESAKTLYELSAYAPTAGVRGVIDKVEVFYHGDPEDATDALKSLINSKDRQRRKIAKQVSDDIPTSGSVNGDFRVEGVPLAYNTVCIRFYITHRVPMGAADKGVVANQLKTTVQEPLRGRNETESGRKIGILFGRTSVDARIVGSVMRIGTSLAVSLRGGECVGMILDGEEAPKLPAKL